MIFSTRKVVTCFNPDLFINSHPSVVTSLTEGRLLDRVTATKMTVTPADDLLLSSKKLVILCDLS